MKAKSENPGLEELRSYLARISAKELGHGEHEEAERLLFKCWCELEILSDDAKLEPYKLLHRTEGLTWNPPLLSFDIERHAATVGGSIYAHVYSWTVNVESGTATMEENPTRRQVRSKDKALKVAPIADEIVRLVVNRERDERLKWSKDSSQVTLLFNKIIKATNWRTRAGRKERFWKVFEKEIQGRGWEVAAGQVQTLPSGFIRIPARVLLERKPTSKEPRP